MHPELAPTTPADPFAALDVIEQPNVSVAWLRRPLALPTLGPWLAGLGSEAQAAWGWEGGAVDLDAALPALLRPLPEEVHRVIAGDLRALLPRFGRWVARRHLRVRFEALAHDGCRKFHVDYMALRLLVSYHGPGTEFVLDPHVDRRWLGASGASMEECNARIVPEPRHVQRAHAGDVLVLKGEHFRGAAGRAAVHRSPPIEAAASRRLVMKIDVDNCGC
jgi:hypothetical protein